MTRNPDTGAFLKLEPFVLIFHSAIAFANDAPLKNAVYIEVFQSRR